MNTFLAHWVDIVVIGVIFISSVLGYFRGFVKESITLATWILAIWAALVYGPTLAGYLPFTFGGPSLMKIIGSGLLFFLIIIVGGVFNYLISQIVDETRLGKIDNTLGLFFGAFRGAVVITIAVFLLISLASVPDGPWWTNSYTMPYFQDAALWIKGQLPESWAGYFS